MSGQSYAYTKLNSFAFIAGVLVSTTIGHLIDPPKTVREDYEKQGIDYYIEYDATVLELLKTERELAILTAKAKALELLKEERKAEILACKAAAKRLVEIADPVIPPKGKTAQENKKHCRGREKENRR